MKFFKCIKEPEYMGNEANMFISYTFHNGDLSYNFDGQKYGYPRFSLGCIYRTAHFSEEYVVDDVHTYHKLIEVRQYLEPFELVIDDLSQKIMDNKKHDTISITPIKQYDKFTSYLIAVSTETRDGRKVTIQIYVDSIYNGLIDCYRRLRTRNGNYCAFYSLLHNKMYPMIRRREKLK